MCGNSAIWLRFLYSICTERRFILAILLHSCALDHPLYMPILVPRAATAGLKRALATVGLLGRKDPLGDSLFAVLPDLHQDLTCWTNQRLAVGLLLELG